jgi:hypothetical protein
VFRFLERFVVLFFLEKRDFKKFFKPIIYYYNK